MSGSTAPPIRQPAVMDPEQYALRHDVVVNALFAATAVAGAALETAVEVCKGFLFGSGGAGASAIFAVHMASYAKIWLFLTLCQLFCISYGWSTPSLASHDKKCAESLAADRVRAHTRRGAFGELSGSRAADLAPIGAADSCRICLDQLAETEAALAEIKHCGHVFCEPCITRWFSESHTCPICVQDIGLRRRGAAVGGFYCD